MKANTPDDARIISAPADILNFFSPDAKTNSVRIMVGPAAILMILQAAAALVTIIKGFKKEEYDSNLSRELHSIYGALTEILAYLNGLIPEVLRALENSFRKDLEGLVYAKKNDFEVEFAFLKPAEQKNPSRKTREKFEAIAALQCTNAFHLQIYGSLAYIGIASAAFSTIAMWTFARSPASGVRKFIEKQIEWFEMQIDPAVTGSFGAGLAYLNAQGDDQKHYVEDGRFLHVFLGYYVTYSGGGRDGDGGGRGGGRGGYILSETWHNFYADRSGDFQNGVSYNATEFTQQSGENPLRQTNSPIEGNLRINHPSEPGARAVNLQNHFNDGARARGFAFYARALAVQAHIDAIKKIIEYLRKIHKEYKF